MAKKGGGQQSNPSADAMAQISQDLFRQTDPLRQALLSRSMGVMGVPQPMPVAQTMPGGLAKISDRLAGLQVKAGAVPPEGLRNIVSGLPFEPSISPVKPITPVTPTAPGSPAFDPSQSFLYSPLKTAVENQYKVARNNIISSTAPGGALTSRLADLEESRANMLSAGVSDILDKEYSTALSLATGGTTQALGGLGSAGAIQAQLQAANQARQSSAKQGLGSGLGYLGGMYLGGPAGAKAGGAVGGKR